MGEAFREIYERHYRDVYRFALFLSGHPSKADDLTAETFVRAWTARDRIRQPSVRSYLLTIARNLYLDHRRASARFSPLEDLFVDGMPRPDERAVHRRGARRQRRRGQVAGEASADTRALIEEYFQTDPEFRRMAERFQAILDETRRRGGADTDAARERETFDRVRSWAKRRQETRAMALGFGLAAAFAAFMGFAKAVPLGRPHPGSSWRSCSG